MKIVAISDTHGKHHQINVPEGDMIIHAGDVSSVGSLGQVYAFLEWFESLPHQHKIFIAGNHDFAFDEGAYGVVIPESIHYLLDSSIVIEGIKIWGSPVTPWFYDWAFNVHRGAPIKRYWDRIPCDTNILVTHGPPYGILDMNFQGERCGCEELLTAVKRIAPRYHIFGHIHEGHGTEIVDGVTFINSSAAGSYHNPVNKPIEFTYQ